MTFDQERDKAAMRYGTRSYDPLFLGGFEAGAEWARERQEAECERYKRALEDVVEAGNQPHDQKCSFDMLKEALRIAANALRGGVSDMEKAEEKLKPCPFCGGMNPAIVHEDDYVLCQDCGANGSFEGETAADGWNTRVSDKLESETKRLRAALYAVRALCLGELFYHCDQKNVIDDIDEIITRCLGDE